MAQQLDAADCGALVRHAIGEANKRVANIPGISGTVDGDLQVDEQYRRVEVAVTTIPIDTLVNTSFDGIPTSKEEFEEAEAQEIDLTGEIGDFPVDDGLGDDDVALLEVFSDDDEEEEEEGAVGGLLKDG